MKEDERASKRRGLDDQERLVLRCLIQDPRMSDTKISEETGVPLKTVNRKRIRLEKENLVSYFASPDLHETGLGRFTTRHLYIIRFKLGVTVKQIHEEIYSEPNVKKIFTELIFESHLAEIDGHVALIMLVEGQSDADIVENVQSKIIPSLKKNHGDDAILDISTIRLLMPIRVMHNYLPLFNMSNGRLSEDVDPETIFVD